ncbi:hypothetical protein GCM10009733_040170 [Nonomuraea maheshkhaliensis]|uniref:Uncharacterized protein n=1 Tax=Nonomuraea maheshkhaliensis TaxID=419590 RepID=A0ABN2FBE1_9ACTN
MFGLGQQYGHVRLGVLERRQLSPQLHLIFVRERGWSPDTGEEWARTTLRHPGLHAGASLIKIR